MDRRDRSQVSYAKSAQSRSGQAVIKLIENTTGRLHLIQRARDYDAEIAQGHSFWEVMVSRYGLRLDVVSGAIADIPAEGPLVVVANHPFGILDGLIMGYLLSTRRGDFRILANSVFQDAPYLNQIILPISFDNTKDAAKLNLETRAKALEFLKAGGAIGVFPGGTVSTAAKPFQRPFDPSWRRFTARMITKSNATVVPVFFDGQNSRLFQLASHIHYNLRVALLLKEFRRRTDKPVKITIGAAIAPARIAAFSDDAQYMMNFLRNETYGISPRSIGHLTYGLEFEEKAQGLTCHSNCGAKLIFVALLCLSVLRLQETHRDRRSCNHPCRSTQHERQTTCLISQARQQGSSQPPARIGHVVKAYIHRDPLCLCEGQDQIGM